MSSTAPALETIGVSLRYGGNLALDDVSVDAAAGEVTGLIGPNGAGKTSLFNVVGGLLRPDRGRVRLQGADITGLPTHARARAGLARTFQRLELFGVLSALGNVRVAADLARRRGGRVGPSADEVATALLERVGLTAVADVRADQLPTGQARLVELARALAAQPSVLLLDEPASGLDESETATFGALLRELAADGMAVVLVEHDVSLVMAVCDRVHVLDVGRLLASGTAAEVRADTRVHDAYLGVVTVLSAASVVARPLVELRGLRAAYGRIEVLHGIDLDVASGSVTALLGPNGAGKTTTLRVLAGLHRASGGDVVVAGRRVNDARPDDLARAGLCLVPEGRGIFPNLTVRENLRVATHVGRSIDEVEGDAFDRFPRLAERRNQLAGTLSGGEQQMLALARAVASRPALLLLDELSMGLAPMVVAGLYDEVAAIAADGVAVLVVEQFARVALRVADRAAVLLHGTIAASGAPSDIEGSLTEVYLGGS